MIWRPWKRIKELRIMLAGARSRSDFWQRAHSLSEDNVERLESKLKSALYTLTYWYKAYLEAERLRRDK